MRPRTARTSRGGRARSPASPTSRASWPRWTRARPSSSRASTSPGIRSRCTAVSSRRSSATPRRRTPTSRRAGRRDCPVHHDTHDVFVLQVAGTKRWLVYDPVLELPLRDQRYAAELGAPGETVLDVVLGAGRHALPAARLAAPGAHVGRRFAPPDRRRQRRPVARGAARGARRAARTTSSSGVRCRRTDGAATSCSSGSRRGSTRTRWSRRHASASSATRTADPRRRARRAPRARRDSTGHAASSAAEP